MSSDDQRILDEADYDEGGDEGAVSFRCADCGLPYSWDDGDECETDICAAVGRLCYGCFNEHVCGGAPDPKIPTRPGVLMKRQYNFDEEKTEPAAAPRTPNPGSNREIRKGDIMRVSVQLIDLLKQGGGVSRLVEVMDVLEQADGTKDLILTNGRDTALMSDERKRG